MVRSAHPAVVVAAATLLVAAGGYIDYRTGHEVSVFPLYAIPIAWAAWSVSYPAGMALTLLATAAWLAADRASGHHYSHPWIQWERAGMHILILGFVSFSFSSLRRNIDLRARQVRQLEGILPICIACKRISEGQKGDWVELDAYLVGHGAAQPEPCLCPDCLGTRYRKA